MLGRGRGAEAAWPGVWQLLSKFLSYISHRAKDPVWKGTGGCPGEKVISLPPQSRQEGGRLAK